MTTPLNEFTLKTKIKGETNNQLKNYITFTKFNLLNTQQWKPSPKQSQTSV